MNKQVSIYNVVWLSLIHIIAIFGIFTFSWTGLAIAVFLHWLTGSLGICLGYHRLLTHTGMKTYGWLRYTLASLGMLAGEGSPMDWVANHRKHHAFSDKEGDPHTPNDGRWWSHVFWLAYRTDGGDREGYLNKWVPDLYKEKGMHKLDKLFLPLNVLLGLILFDLGYLIDGGAFGVSLLVWGMFVRLVFVLHATWMVNSASHIWGYKNYKTRDDSRNNWLVAIVAYGEGWHNNHHAYPRMAKHGHKWWEFDITWQSIKLLKKLRLVWEVSE